MEATARIDLRRQRDFGGTVGVVFEFLRQNFVPLGKSILFLVGPLMVLVAVLMGLYIRSIFGFMPGLGDGPTPSASEVGSEIFSVMVWFVPAVIIVSAVTMTMMSAIVNGYVVLYQEREPGSIDVDDVWRETRSIFWRVMAAQFVVILLGVGMYAIGALIGVALGMWALLLIPLFMVAIVYVFVMLSVVIPACVIEGVSVFTALSRSFYLVKGRWWFTFGVHFVVALVVMVVNFAISMIFM